MISSEDSPTKLYVIVRSHFMADFILQGISGRDDVVIVPHRPRKGLWVTFLKALRMKLGNPRGLWANSIFPREMVRALRSVRPGDKVLLWGVENYKYTAIMAAEMKAGKIVSFLWNPMKRLLTDSAAKTRYISEMKRRGVELCTFDPIDAEALGAKLVPQVYRRTALSQPPEGKPRVFFVGYEKGREGALAELISALDAEGIEMDINVIRHKRFDGTERHPAIVSRLLDDVIPYDEVLRRIAGATAIIDMVQPGQRGITLRSLEALFYGKKLITNNPSVRNQPFYRIENVYLIREDPRRLSDFLTEPYLLVEESIAARHDIVSWIDEVMR